MGGVSEADKQGEKMMTMKEQEGSKARKEDYKPLNGKLGAALSLIQRLEFITIGQLCELFWGDGNPKSGYRYLPQLEHRGLVRRIALIDARGHLAAVGYVPGGGRRSTARLEIHQRAIDRASMYIAWLRAGGLPDAALVGREPRGALVFQVQTQAKSLYWAHWARADMICRTAHGPLAVRLMTGKTVDARAHPGRSHIAHLTHLARVHARFGSVARVDGLPPALALVLPDPAAARLWEAALAGLGEPLAGAVSVHTVESLDFRTWLRPAEPPLGAVVARLGLVPDRPQPASGLIEADFPSEHISRRPVLVVDSRRRDLRAANKARRATATMIGDPRTVVALVGGESDAAWLAGLLPAEGQGRPRVPVFALASDGRVWRVSPDASFGSIGLPVIAPVPRLGGRRKAAKQPWPTVRSCGLEAVDLTEVRQTCIETARRR